MSFFDEEPSENAGSSLSRTANNEHQSRTMIETLEKSKVEAAPNSDSSANSRRFISPTNPWFYSMITALYFGYWGVSVGGRATQVVAMAGFGLVLGFAVSYGTIWLLQDVTRAFSRMPVALKLMIVLVLLAFASRLFN